VLDFESITPAKSSKSLEHPSYQLSAFAAMALSPDVAASNSLICLTIVLRTVM
jgi:hypothetical protein